MAYQLQGGLGNVGINTNKQAIARALDIKQSEVAYVATGTILDNYKALYDKTPQELYALPSGIASGSSVLSLVSGLLTHSNGSIDLGEYALLRGEWKVITESFDTGFTLTAKNQVVLYDDKLWAWGGTMNKPVAAGSDPYTEGVSPTDWFVVQSVKPSRFVPRIYGAKADGTTVDSAAFAKVIDAMSAGDTLDLEGKSYLAEIIINKAITVINGKVTAPASATKAAVFIDGVSARILNVQTVVDTANITYTANNVSGILAENADGVYMYQCTADGSKCNSYTATASWGVLLGAYNSSNIVIESCTGKNSAKEGIITRFCDKVFILNTQGYASGAGYSCIGTSGGDIAIIANCYAEESGATAITMNNHTSIVIGSTVDSNANFNGILIGHNHETQQYAGSCMVVNCIVRNSATNGICIDKPLNCLVANNVIENAGTSASLGNGILTNNPQAGAMITIANNTIRGASAAGIYAAMQDLANGYQCLIEGNQVYGALLNAIRVENDLYTRVINNKLRNAGQNAIRVWVSAVGKRSELVDIQSNTIEYCGYNSIDVLGPKRLITKGNTHLGFNQSNLSALSATVIRGSDGTNNFELPDVIHACNETFLEGNVGSGMHSITIITDNLTTTGKVCTVQACHFTDVTRPPVTVSSRYAQAYQACRRGADAGLVTVSVPASGTLTVTNSNQTSLNLPNIVRRDSNNNVSLTSYGLGTLVLTNYGTGAAGITLTW